jgi:hypothetical protein
MIMIFALIVVALVVSTFSIFHTLHVKKVLQLSDNKPIHLKCSVCSCLVARFEQLEDHSIRCVNCKREHELILRRRGA